jgi:fructose-1,6-bisphosphatase I
MFAIAKRNLTSAEDYHLRSGEEFICSGMFSIPTGLFTFALKNAGAWRFYMDASGDYIRPTKITLPDKADTWELSWNTANKNFYKDGVINWLEKNSHKYAFRYAGSLAIDFHRLLLNGGMFLYPAIVNHEDPSKNRPNGKLRLMYECAVIAFIAKEAGGRAINDQGEDILKIVPSHRHQRSSIYVGNTDLVNEIQRSL